jgi:hypothetical protein
VERERERERREEEEDEGGHLWSPDGGKLIPGEPTHIVDFGMHQSKVLLPSSGDVDQVGLGEAHHLGAARERKDHTVPYSTIQYHTVPYKLCSTIQYHTVPYKLCSTIQYHTVPYSTIQYHTNYA